MRILKRRQIGCIGMTEGLLIDELYSRIFKESVRIPTTVPVFKDMSWMEKDIFFGGEHVYYVDENGIIEMDPREVIIKPKEV